MNRRTYPSFRVLLVDDEPAWLDSMGIALERAGVVNVDSCSDSSRVSSLLSDDAVGLVLLDLTMPGLPGRDVLRSIKESHPEIRVIVLTGLNQVETAVECMKAGAYDYIVKTDDRLVMTVLRAVQMIELERENSAISKRLLEGNIEHPEFFEGIVTCAKSMRSIFQYIEAVSRSTHPILVSGESGAGKELIANAVYSASGCSGKLVSVNVAGYDDHMFADALFGHVKGAFTGADTFRPGIVEEASGGMLFLDEIGELSVSSQVKLLRFLNDGEYYQLGSDTPRHSMSKVVVATNQDLRELIKDGRFRKDLFYRLQTHHIHVPSLRERPEDIPLLLSHFVNEASAEFGKKIPGFSGELVEQLRNYSFPGNIRELKALVFDAVARYTAGEFSIKGDFLMSPGREAAEISDTGGERMFSGLKKLPSIEQAEDSLIREALFRSKGNQSMAARLLGMTQSALNKRLKRSAGE
jgi:DNA-binding NtrC family response regulator